MRTISAQEITDTVARLCIEANTRLPQDVQAALDKARQEEPWPLARNTLDLLWSNLSAAKERDLPFGNWNECPDTPDLMAVAKYWFQQYGAIPAAMSHDELEFLLPAPVSQEKAMEVATAQYGFCPDIVDQEQDDPTVGNLADVLRQSTVWYFWWD